MLSRRNFLGGLLATTACSSQMAWALAKSEPIRIGVTGSFSTSANEPFMLGESMRNGARLAATEINLMGGVRGSSIVLVERDDEGQYARAMRVADELINDEKVVAVIGGLNPVTCWASIDLYQTAQVPLLIAGASDVELTRKFIPPRATSNYIFRVAPTMLQEVQLLLRELTRRNLQQVLLLSPADAGWDNNQQQLEQAFKGGAIDIVMQYRSKAGETDFRDVLRAARKQGVNAVLAWGNGNELTALAQNRLQLNWPVPLLGSWVMSSQPFLDQLGAAAEGLMMPQTFIAEFTRSSPYFRNSFFLAYEDSFKTSRIPVPMAATQGYDALNLLVAALRNGNAQTGRELRVALENLRGPIEGAMVRYDKPFSATEHDAITADRLLIGQVHEGRVMPTTAPIHKPSADTLANSLDRQEINSRTRNRP